MNPNNKFNFSSEQLNNSLRAVGIFCLGLLSLFLLVKTINEVKTYSTIGESETAYQNAITVSGKSEMMIKPDVTVLTITIDESANTIEEAQSKAATKEKRAIAFVKEKGIKDGDIKTTYYYTSTKYESVSTPCAAPKMPSMSTSYVAYPCGSKTIEAGYQTTETVEFRIRDITAHPEKAGELIAGLGSMGVKPSNPVSTVDKPEVYKQQVRAEAIAKAKKEAEVLAKNLGVKLVRITSFSENGGGGYPMPMYDRAVSAMGASEKAVAPELPVGTDKISSEVSITYQIR